MNDVQLHPVSDQVMHVDFLRVNKKTKIAVAVPVNFVNEDKCKGLKEKGVMNVIRYEVDLVVSATAIPDAIDIDITDFEIGDSIKISNLIRYCTYNFVERMYAKIFWRNTMYDVRPYHIDNSTEKLRGERIGQS